VSQSNLVQLYSEGKLQPQVELLEQEVALVEKRAADGQVLVKRHREDNEQVLGIARQRKFNARAAKAAAEMAESAANPHLAVPPRRLSQPLAEFIQSAGKVLEPPKPRQLKAAKKSPGNESGGLVPTTGETSTALAHGGPGLQAAGSLMPYLHAYSQAASMTAFQGTPLPISYIQPMPPAMQHLQLQQQQAAMEQYQHQIQQLQQMQQMQYQQQMQQLQRLQQMQYQQQMQQQNEQQQNEQQLNEQQQKQFQEYQLQLQQLQQQQQMQQMQQLQQLQQLQQQLASQNQHFGGEKGNQHEGNQGSHGGDGGQLTRST